MEIFRNQHSKQSGMIAVLEPDQTVSMTRISGSDVKAEIHKGIVLALIQWDIREPTIHNGFGFFTVLTEPDGRLCFVAYVIGLHPVCPAVTNSPWDATGSRIGIGMFPEAFTDLDQGQPVIADVHCSPMEVEMEALAGILAGLVVLGWLVVFTVY